MRKHPETGLLGGKQTSLGGVGGASVTELCSNRPPLYCWQLASLINTVNCIPHTRYI